jgi:hypothetical protein
MVGAARLLDRFGFSWTIADLPRTAPKQGLEKLGFPWILSSESRLFNGLRGIFREGNFSRPFAAGAGRAGTGGGILTMQRRGMAHQASLTHFLLFCNQLLSTEIVEPATGRFRGLSVIVNDTSFNPELDGKSLDWVFSKVSP